MKHEELPLTIKLRYLKGLLYDDFYWSEDKKSQEIYSALRDAVEIIEYLHKDSILRSKNNSK